MEWNRISASFAISSAQCERTIFGIKCDVRSALNTSTVETLIRLSGKDSSVEKFDPSDSIDHWFSTNRKMGNYTHCYQIAVIMMMIFT
jgi:hypothetical protein